MSVRKKLFCRVKRWVTDRFSSVKNFVSVSWEDTSQEFKDGAQKVFDFGTTSFLLGFSFYFFFGFNFFGSWISLWMLLPVLEYYYKWLRVNWKF